MGTFLLLIKSIPELLSLLSALQDAIKQAETDRKVQTDLAALTGAINEKNIDKINHLFNASGAGGVQPVATLETKH